MCVDTVAIPKVQNSQPLTLACGADRARMARNIILYAQARASMLQNQVGKPVLNTYTESIL